MPEAEDPPLAESDRRIVIIGNTGSGKTALARRLALRIGVPHVELDALHWEPNWTPAATDVFRERVARAADPESWVADGNYRAIRDVLWPKATTLVWLDYPLAVSMWRLFWRVMRRGVRHQELWNGNRETVWTHFLTKDSLFLWAIKTHRRRNREFPEALRQPEHAHLRLLRFRSPRATDRWLGALATGAPDD